VNTLDERLKFMAGGDDCLIRLALVEIESLRQQLADMTAYADKRNTVALDLEQQLAAMEDKYLVERGMLRLKRAEFEDSQKREVMLRDALWNQLNDCINFNGGRLTTCIMEASTEALAATADLDGLILCEKKPVARKISYGSLVFLEGYAELSGGTSLYRAWEPK